MIVPTLQRWAFHTSARVARSLEEVDRRRHARWRRRQAGDPALGTEPEAVLAAVAHWRPDAPEALPQRLGLLERCTAELLAMPAATVVAVVVTNEPEQTARDLAERLGGGVPVRVAPPAALDAAPGAAREVLVVGWRPGLRYRHGYYLTWAHVPLLRRAAATGRYSHLLYVEDDMRFGPEQLRYWTDYRAPLAEHGLLPGFVRFERRDGERYLVDALEPAGLPLRTREVRVGGDAVRVVNLDNPYQALYVLDRPLFEPHFRFSRGRSTLHSRAGDWGVRERAASGPILDAVPPGLVSRTAVPVRAGDDRLQLEPACLVEHMAPTYSSAPGSEFGVVRVEELFPAGAR